MPTFAALALAVFLIVAGIAHFVAPGYFRTLVPDWLPAPGAFVAASGGTDIMTGALVLVPGTRAVGGWVAAALITAFLISHIDALRQASTSRQRFIDRPAGVALRLVVNGAYIAWAVTVALSAS